jgi:hypothetical protein
VQEWLRRERSHQKKGALLQRAKLKLVGHLNYYAITDNARMCDAFRIQTMRLLFKWMNRQSQRRSYNWAQFIDALVWVGWPSVRIRHNLDCRPEGALKSRMLGKPLVRFCEGQGGN